MFNGDAGNKETGPDRRTNENMLRFHLGGVYRGVRCDER